ncbi:hypothetical protein [Methylorubrum populi]|uniref:hypothetical protein n=1 Tax=Methylorubrum populi TaxID=223967 RepID=UPI001265275F|nr:hypothetical protein [Methylorubrum populi]
MDETSTDLEIEITPAMLEAGVDVLWDYDPETHSKREIVLAILRASLSAKRQKSSSRPKPTVFLQR